MDKLLESFGTLIGFIAFTFALKWWERRQEAMKKAQYKIKNSLEFTNDIDREVRHELRKIRDRHNAMRLYIIHVSNGTVTEAGLPLLKITFKSEVVLDYQVHVESISKNFQEVPMPSMFLSPMMITLKSGEFYLKKKDDLNLKDNNQRDYYNWLGAYGVGSTMWLSIYKNHKPVAIMVAHWPQPTDLDGTIIARIKDIKRNVEKIYESIK